MKFNHVIFVAALFALTAVPTFQMRTWSRIPLATAEISINDGEQTESAQIYPRGNIVEFKMPRISVRQASVQCDRPVTCFFTQSKEPDYVGLDLMSSYFSQDEDLTTPFEWADGVACYDSTFYAEDVPQSYFVLLVERPSVKGRDILRFRLGEGKKYRRIDAFEQGMFDKVSRVAFIETTSKGANIIDTVEGRASSVSDVSDEPTPGRNEATCFVEPYRSGVLQMRLGETVTVGPTPEPVRGFTCFKAGYTEEDLEKVRSRDILWKD